MKPRYAGKPLPRRDGSLSPDTDAGKHDRDPVHDRPVGPMQLAPATWALVGVDGDGNGRRNPYDIDDAALAVAVLLCAKGDDLSTPAGLRSGVAQVSTSEGFLAAVLAVARGYDRELESAPRPVVLPQLPTRLAARPVVALARPTTEQTRAALNYYGASAEMPTATATVTPVPPITPTTPATPTTPVATELPSPTDLPSPTSTATSTPTPTTTPTEAPTTTASTSDPTDDPSSSSPSASER